MRMSHEFTRERSRFSDSAHHRNDFLKNATKVGTAAALFLETWSLCNVWSTEPAHILPHFVALAVTSFAGMKMHDDFRDAAKYANGPRSNAINNLRSFDQPYLAKSNLSVGAAFLLTALYVPTASMYQKIERLDSLPTINANRTISGTPQELFCDGKRKNERIEISVGGQPHTFICNH